VPPFKLDERDLMGGRVRFDGCDEPLKHGLNNVGGEWMAPVIAEEVTHVDRRLQLPCTHGGTTDRDSEWTASRGHE
jgi:hypothetical protein